MSVSACIIAAFQDGDGESCRTFIDASLDKSSDK